MHDVTGNFAVISNGFILGRSGEVKDDDLMPATTEDVAQYIVPFSATTGTATVASGTLTSKAT